MTYFIQILTGTLGAFGFAILYNLRGTKLLIATLGGALSWGTYLFFGIWFHSEPLRYFFAAIAVTIYAEIFARIKKTPTSTFLIVPMIPLIPGGVLYYTMSYALKNDWNNFVTSAFYTIKLAMSRSLSPVAFSPAGERPKSRVCGIWLTADSIAQALSKMSLTPATDRD